MRFQFPITRLQSQPAMGHSSAALHQQLSRDGSYCSGGPTSTSHPVQLRRKSAIGSAATLDVPQGSIRLARVIDCFLDQIGSRILPGACSFKRTVPRAASTLLAGREPWLCLNPAGSWLIRFFAMPSGCYRIVKTRKIVCCTCLNAWLQASR